MTSVTVKGIKVKDGKLVRVIRYATKRKKIAVAREAAAWARKNPAGKGGAR